MFILLAIYNSYKKAYLVWLLSINVMEVADLLKAFMTFNKICFFLSESFLPSLRDIIEMEDLI